MNYYQKLNISNNADIQAIKNAYRKLAIQYHPDKNIGNEEFYSELFIELTGAYNVLCDEDKRIEYDRSLVSETEKDDHTSKTSDAQKQESKQTANKNTDNISGDNIKYKKNNPFFSASYRRQEADYPIFDIYGNPLPENLEFIKIPSNIGPIIGAYSTLHKGDTPKKTIYKIIYFIVAVTIGFSLGAFISYLFSANTFWSVTWCVLGIFFLGRLSFRVNSFTHINLFLGVNGFAEYLIKGNRTKIVTEAEYNFKDFRFSHVDIKHNYSSTGINYVDSSYTFQYLDKEGLSEIFLRKGRFNKNKKDLYFDFLNLIEKYWTIYQLDNIESHTDENGELRILFFISGVPYIFLGVGYIKFIYSVNTKESVTYRFDDIKKMYYKNNNLVIEHKNFKKNFFSKSGNRDEIPLSSLLNKGFFFEALRILLGYKVD